MCWPTDTAISHLLLHSQPTALSPTKTDEPCHSDQTRKVDVKMREKTVLTDLPGLERVARHCIPDAAIAIERPRPTVTREIVCLFSGRMHVRAALKQYSGMRLVQLQYCGCFLSP